MDANVRHGGKFQRLKRELDLVVHLIKMSESQKKPNPKYGELLLQKNNLGTPNTAT